MPRPRSAGAVLHMGRAPGSQARIGGRESVRAASVTRNHWRIATNLVLALGTRLDRSGYDVGAGDFAVQTGPQDVRFADVMVAPFSQAGGERSTTDALLLVEMTSPSTTHVDSA